MTGRKQGRSGSQGKIMQASISPDLNFYSRHSKKHWSILGTRVTADLHFRRTTLAAVQRTDLLDLRGER